MNEEDEPLPTMGEIEAMVSEACRPDRLMAIQPNEEYGWWCGHLADGTPLMLLPETNDMTIVHFESDGTGRLNGTERVPFEWPQGHLLFSVESVEQAVCQHYGRAFTSGTIRVHAFTLEFGEEDRMDIAVDPLPADYREFLSSPDAWEESEREDMRRYILDWVRKGDCVVLYGNDYWLDDTGDVHSS